MKLKNFYMNSNLPQSKDLRENCDKIYATGVEATGVGAYIQIHVCCMQILYFTIYIVASIKIINLNTLSYILLLSGSHFYSHPNSIPLPPTNTSLSKNNQTILAYSLLWSWKRPSVFLLKNAGAGKWWTAAQKM